MVRAPPQLDLTKVCKNARLGIFCHLELLAHNDIMYLHKSLFYPAPSQDYTLNCTYTAYRQNYNIHRPWTGHLFMCSRMWQACRCRWKAPKLRQCVFRVANPYLCACHNNMSSCCFAINWAACLQHLPARGAWTNGLFLVSGSQRPCEGGLKEIT